MPGDLILNSLEIQRFRCFRELRIERLGRVNLVVGKNNVGKSTILDALRLFAKPGSLADLLEILAARNEISPVDPEEWSTNHRPPLPVDSLFFGREAVLGEENAIRIGPTDVPAQNLNIAYHARVVQPITSVESLGSYKSMRVGDFFTGFESLLFQVGDAARIIPVGARSLDRLGLAPHSQPPTATDPESLIRPIRDIPIHAVGPDGLAATAVVRLWDDIALSSLETDVIRALRLISPEIERIAVKGPSDRIKRNTQGRDAGDRSAFAKVEGFDEPMPLRALGDGVSRLFGVALALVGAKGGLFLVDEIENGIHYSVQADLWRLIFETAARLNVQVFATTHSYDCIKAFEEAARESEEEGVLVRLARKGDRTLVGEFDERDLEVAIEGDIEVR